MNRYPPPVLQQLRQSVSFLQLAEPIFGGAKFGYICSSGINPMLELYLEAGIDVLIGIDPIQGTHTNMFLLKEKLGGQVCLWGGVSAAVTVERGTENEIRAAVRQAIETLGPKGYVLSPIDNITVDDPRTWQNIDVFIDEWKNLCWPENPSKRDSPLIRRRVE